MSHSSDEDHIFQVVSAALKRWLAKARNAVVSRFSQRPNPDAIYALQGDWNSEVDTILTELGKISMNAWSQATNVPPVSRHAFVMSQLAQTKNFLVNIPNEVADLVFAAITDSINSGGDVEATAKAVDDVLNWTGSQNWAGRARNIAMTETTRAYGAGTLGAGMEQARVTGRQLQKKWMTENDAKVRPSHRAVNGQVTDLASPYYVGGFPLLYPGDPAGPPDEVCGCRCDLAIVDEKGAANG